MFHERTIGKVLHRLGFAKLSGRPKPPRPTRPHKRSGEKPFATLAREALPEDARDKPIEVWFADAARVGQQGRLTRLWARRGPRPRAPKAWRYAWADLFGAVCPERGVGAGLVRPDADTRARSAHLAEISLAVTPGAHAVLVLDQAGWHGARALVVPDNLTLVPLPPYSPELNPIENVWPGNL